MECELSYANLSASPLCKNLSLGKCTCYFINGYKWSENLQRLTHLTFPFPKISHDWRLVGWLVGWLGGALLWHFAAMWLLLANGLLYLAINLLSGRFSAKFFPISPILCNNLRRMRYSSQVIYHLVSMVMVGCSKLNFKTAVQNCLLR